MPINLGVNVNDREVRNFYASAAKFAGAYTFEQEAKLFQDAWALNAPRGETGRLAASLEIDFTEEGWIARDTSGYALPVAAKTCFIYRAIESALEVGRLSLEFMKTFRQTVR